MLKPSQKTFPVTVPEIGDFIFRYPTLMDELSIERRTNQLLGPNENPSVIALNIAFMAATVETMATQAPAGWKIEDLYALKDLEPVYKAYKEQVSQFRGEADASLDEGAGGG